MADIAVDFELQALGNIGGAGFESGVEKDSAVAIAFAPETERKLEILERPFGLKIAVVFGQAAPVDDSVFYRPTLVADLYPAAKVLAIKEWFPIFARQFGLLLLRISSRYTHTCTQCNGKRPLPVFIHSINQLRTMHYVTIGIIGLGFMGATHLAACSKLDNLRVAAVSTRDTRALSGDLSHIGGNLKRETPLPDFSNVAKYPNWRDLIADSTLDAVDICLPTDLHEPVATAALEAGKHVLCEKPMALSAKDCETMLSAAKVQNRILMIGHVLRWWPAYRHLHDLVQSHKYGSIRSATFVRQCGVPDWSGWLSDESRSGGAVLDLLIHDIDQALALFGWPKAVRAKHLMNGDTLAATLLFPNGPEVRIQGGWLTSSTPFSMSFQVQAQGAYLDYSADKLELSDINGVRTVIPLEDEDPYGLQLSYFADCCIQMRQPDLCPPEASAAAVKLALALKESRALNGELVTCEQ